MTTCRRVIANCSAGLAGYARNCTPPVCVAGWPEHHRAGRNPKRPSMTVSFSCRRKERRTLPGVLGFNRI